MRYLENYQPFINKKELNDVIALHLSRCTYQLNETDRDVLRLLSRYAVKYPGVAHLKLETIAVAIKKSIRTVRRATEKLANLKVIERRTFTRKKSGGDGANLYIFLPAIDRPDMSARGMAKNPVAPMPERVKIESEPIPLLSKDLCMNHTSTQPAVAYYNHFKNHLKSFTGEDNQQSASKFYGIYLAQTKCLLKFSIHEDKGELLEALALQAIQITCQATKNKKIRNPYGYFDGVLRELIDKSLFSNAFMDYDVPVELINPSLVSEYNC